MNRNYIIIGAAILIIVGGFFLYQSKREQITNYPPKNDVIVAFGDSLVYGYGSTQGKDFVSQLSVQLQKPIINLGVSGNTTADGLQRVDDVLSKSPGTVFVLLGGNDYLKRVPQEETFRNLRLIIEKIQASGALVVLLGIRGGLLTDHFDSDFENLAKSTHSLFVPNVLDGLLGKQTYMFDEIHPNDKGYALIAEKIYKAVQKYAK